MKKLISLLATLFVLGGSFGNAQLIDEKMFKKMEKDAKESYFSGEEGLPENTLVYFNKNGTKELGYVSVDSLKNKKLSYKFNEKDSLFIWFDSTGAFLKADYKMPNYEVPLDSNDCKKIKKIFSPVINQ